MEVENCSNDEQFINMVGFFYLSGLITDVELQDYKDRLVEFDIKLMEIDKDGEVYNNIEELTNTIQFLLAGSFMLQVANGILPNAIYDVLKSIVISTLNKVRNKRYTEHTAGGKSESKPVSLGMEFQIEKENYKFKLDNLENDETAIIALDKILDFVREQKSIGEDSNEFIVNFNNDNQIWIKKDVKIIINEIIENQKTESN